MPTKEISFRVSKTQFWIITLLILLLPVSSKYKLLIYGKKTEGVVVNHKKVTAGLSRIGGYDIYSVIQFTADSLTVRMYGPENTIYDIGERLTVIYDRNNPRKCIIFSLGYLYTTTGVVLPAIVLLLWLAFYLAFKERKTNRKPHGKIQA